MNNDTINVATAQFENKSGDKEYNLGIIEKLAGEAASRKTQAIAFHECSITGYTFARHLSKQQMLDLAELIPEGPSVRRLTEISAKHNITVLAGLFEKDKDDNLFVTCFSAKFKVEGGISFSGGSVEVIDDYVTPYNSMVV